MKIQCNVCEAAEAKVLCCADEAALCRECDKKIHAANKLASKHLRVPLSSSSSQMPKCDICRDAVGYFFCLEDRALFCRKCDVAIHTVNEFVSAHQRFLLTGVKVGVEPTDPSASTSSAKSHFEEMLSETKSPISKKVLSVAMSSEQNESFPIHNGGVGELTPVKISYTGGYVAGSTPQWPLDEFFGLSDFSQSFDYVENGSSKADSGKLGESDSSLLRSSEEGDDDEHLDCVPDASWTVPQIPSPPTASGLCWPANIHFSFDSTMFVPDIGFSHMKKRRALRHVSGHRSSPQQF